MSYLETKEKLISDLNKIDSAISIPMTAVSTSIFGIALVLLLADMIFQISTNYVGLSLMVTSISINISARYASNKAKSVVLEIRGLKCGNCSKTPPPASIYSEFPIAYCPHCQLKYSDNDAKAAQQAN